MDLAILKLHMAKFGLLYFCTWQPWSFPLKLGGGGAGYKSAASQFFDMFFIKYFPACELDQIVLSHLSNGFFALFSVKEYYCLEKAKMEKMSNGEGSFGQVSLTVPRSI